MKKRFSMLLAVAMVMSLVACNGSKTAETPAEAVQAENGSESSEAADGDGEAQELWAPEKTVDFIVPFNAGGSSDLLARVFANQGSSYFDTEFVIINEGGGSCSIGLTDLITREPDGYAVGICNNGVPTLPLSMETPYVYKDELDAVCMWGIAPYVVVVNADSEYQTLTDLMDAIKENPNSLVSGACSAGSNTHIEMEMLAYMVDSDIKSVIFDGGSSAIAALLGNNIDVTVQTPTDAAQYIESGDLRCVAVLAEERMTDELFADIPTAIEQGYDLTSECFQGVGAPKGLPDEVIAYYEKCFSEALQDPAVVEAISNLGFEVHYENHEEYQARWDRTAEEFQTIVDTLGDRLVIS